MNYFGNIQTKSEVEEINTCAWIVLNFTNFSGLIDYDDDKGLMDIVIKGFVLQSLKAMIHLTM